MPSGAFVNQLQDRIRLAKQRERVTWRLDGSMILFFLSHRDSSSSKMLSPPVPLKPPVRDSVMRDLRAAIPEATRLLGADNSRVLNARRALAVLTRESGDRTGAIHQLRELIRDATRALGPDRDIANKARTLLADYQQQAT
jgi:hypothetical protein